MHDTETFEIFESTDRQTLAAGIEDGVAYVRYARAFDVPANALWAIVGDLGNLQSMGNFISEVVIEGEGAGAIRRMHLSASLGGEWIAEHIDEYDDRRRFYRYSFLDFGSLPWADYRGLLAVYSRGERRSSLYFESEEFPLGVTHREAAEVSISNITGYADRLETILPGAR